MGPYGCLAGGPACAGARVTVNRLCGSGLEAVAYAARAIKAGRDRFLSQGAQRVCRARRLSWARRRLPFRGGAEVYDTTIGWRL